MMCTKSGVDFYRMNDVFKKDCRRMNSLPMAGFAASPCLLKDTLQLCAFSNNQFFFGDSAVLMNESLPNFAKVVFCTDPDVDDSRLVAFDYSAG